MYAPPNVCVCVRVHPHLQAVEAGVLPPPHLPAHAVVSPPQPQVVSDHPAVEHAQHDICLGGVRIGAAHTGEQVVHHLGGQAVCGLSVWQCPYLNGYK
jgi:hypothetical protein